MDFDDYWAAYIAALPGAGGVCRKYLGDNDGTCPQLTCIRRHGHDGDCDNVRGDDDERREER